MAAFVVSGWWYLGVRVPTRNGPGVRVNGGVFIVSFFQQSGEPWVANSVIPRMGGFLPGPIWQSWNVWELGSGNVFVPLYAVFLAVATPTLLVWRFVPKFPRGHCRRCGYNLTGNTSGVCPECGRETCNADP